MSLAVPIPSTHGRKSGGKDDSGDFKVSVSSPLFHQWGRMYFSVDAKVSTGCR